MEAHFFLPNHFVLIQYFSTESDFDSLREYLAMSGDSFGCHKRNAYVVGRAGLPLNILQCTGVSTPRPPQKRIIFSSVSAEVEELCPKLLRMHFLK